MSEYILIGSTARKNPITGQYEESVPLYIRAEDAHLVDNGRDAIQEIVEAFARRLRRDAQARGEL